MEWIPCSERLPEELEEVNITWINTNPASYYSSIKDKPCAGTGIYYKGGWYWYSAVCTDYLNEYGFSPNDEMDEAIKVIAWMPLPQPYAEKIPEYPCINCCSPSERASCCGCPKESYWRAKYGKTDCAWK